MENVSVIRVRSGESRDQWDSIVESADGHYSQLAAWTEICGRCFGLDGYLLAHRQGDGFKSVFPLAYNPRRRLLESPAYAGIGGVVPSGDLPLYLGEVERLSREIGAVSVSVRLPHDERCVGVLNDFGYNTDHMLPFYVLDLEGVISFEEVRKNIYDRNARRGLRQSRENGIKVVRVEPSRASLSSAYGLYRRTMEFNGAKEILPAEFFSAIGEDMKNHMVVFEAVKDGHTMGAALCFVVGRRIETWFILGVVEARRLFVNNALYSSVIDFAISSGLRYVDFGPSGAFSKANEIKQRHGASVRWVVCAVRFKNPIKRFGYTMRKRVRRWALDHKDSALSRLYRMYALKKLERG